MIQVHLKNHSSIDVHICIAITICLSGNYIFKCRVFNIPCLLFILSCYLLTYYSCYDLSLSLWLCMGIRCWRAWLSSLWWSEAAHCYRQSFNQTTSGAHTGWGDQQPGHWERTHGTFFVTSSLLHFKTICCITKKKPIDTYLNSFSLTFLCHIALFLINRFKMLWPVVPTRPCWWSHIGWKQLKGQTRSLWLTKGRLWSKGRTRNWWRRKAITINWERGSSLRKKKLMRRRPNRNEFLIISIFQEYITIYNNRYHIQKLNRICFLLK